MPRCGNAQVPVTRLVANYFYSSRGTRYGYSSLGEPGPLLSAIATGQWRTPRLIVQLISSTVKTWYCGHCHHGKLNGFSSFASALTRRKNDGAVGSDSVKRACDAWGADGTASLRDLQRGATTAGGDARYCAYRLRDRSPLRWKRRGFAKTYDTQRLQNTSSRCPAVPEVR